MPEEKPNILPPPWDKRVAALIAVAWVVLTGLEKGYPNTLAFSVAADIAAGLGLLFGAPLIGRRIPTATIVLALVFVGVSSAGCVSAAVKTTHGAMTLTQLTGRTLAEVHKTQGDKMCTHIKRWKAGARPGMRLSVAGAVAAIEGKGNVAEKLKPGLCEVARFFEAAKGDLGKNGEAIANALKPYQFLVCPKTKNAAQVLAVLLPIAQAVIKWLMESWNAKSDKLLKEIKDWLAKPPSDETDKLCLN
jgi:hypothetical protein